MPCAPLHNSYSRFRHIAPSPRTHRASPSGNESGTTISTTCCPASRARRATRTAASSSMRFSTRRCVSSPLASGPKCASLAQDARGTHGGRARRWSVYSTDERPCVCGVCAQVISTKYTVVNRAPIMMAWAFVVAERLGFRREEALSIGTPRSPPFHPAVYLLSRVLNSPVGLCGALPGAVRGHRSPPLIIDVRSPPSFCIYGDERGY